jgi:PAS domain S-box-containing protein
MQDEEKTKNQLIDELVALRQRVIEFEISQTQYQQTESALRESFERFRLLVDSAQDYAILTLEPNGNVASWNSGAERILGYSSAEIIGQHGSCIFTPEDRKESEDKKELRTAATFGRADDERWHMRADGTRFWGSGIVTPLLDSAGNLLGFSKIMRDMTERKQAEEQIQRLNTDLERQVTERTAQLQQAFEFEATLKRISDKVRDSLDESQILQTAVQELALVLDIICCDTALYNLVDCTSTICYEYTVEDDEGTLKTPSSIGRVVQMADVPEVYRQLLQGQYFQFCDLTLDPIRSQVAVLSCPIVDDRGCWEIYGCSTIKTMPLMN